MAHHRFTHAAALTATIGIAAASASGVVITTIEPGCDCEPSVWTILNQMLGVNSLNSANLNAGVHDIGGVVGFSRVDDELDGFYRDGDVPVQVMAIFYGNENMETPLAGEEHDLYFENETTGAPAQQVVDYTSVLGPISVGPGEVFSLTAVRANQPFDGSQNNSTNKIASSIPGENIATGVTTADRMVTFAIDLDHITQLTHLDGSVIDLLAIAPDGGSGIAYLHLFDTGLDADFQDAIYMTVGATAIPTPAAIALLAGAGLLTLRRRSR